MSNTSLLGSYGGQAGDGNMFRNRIINGNCLVAQRGNISLVNNSINYGGADRIFISPLSFTTATGTITRSALSGTDSGYGQFAVGVTTTGSGTLVFGQRIESLNTVDLYNKTITFSGVCYQNTGSSISVSLSVRKADSIDNFVTTTQIGSTGTVSVPSGVVTPFSLTVTLGGSDAINGLVVSATFPLGAVSSKDFAVSNFQLEAGPVATPFERRPYGMELALCQRYCIKITTTNYFLGSLNTSTAIDRVQLPVTMRASPTLTLPATLAYYTGGNGNGTAPSNPTYSNSNNNFFSYGAAALTNWNGFVNNTFTLEAEI